MKLQNLLNPLRLVQARTFDLNDSCHSKRWRHNVSCPAELHRVYARNQSEFHRTEFCCAGRNRYLLYKYTVTR